MNEVVGETCDPVIKGMKKIKKKIIRRVLCCPGSEEAVNIFILLFVSKVIVKTCKKKIQKVIELTRSDIS